MKINFYIKYRKDGNPQIIAVTTYAGRTVKSTAKCHSEDEFDYYTGCDLARLRLLKKVAERRYKSAQTRYGETVKQVEKAVKNEREKWKVMQMAGEELEKANQDLKDYLNNID